MFQKGRQRAASSDLFASLQHNNSSDISTLDGAPLATTTPSLLEDLRRDSVVEEQESDFYDQEFTEYVNRPDSPFSDVTTVLAWNRPASPATQPPIERPSSRAKENRHSRSRSLPRTSQLSDFSPASPVKVSSRRAQSVGPKNAVQSTRSSLKRTKSLLPSSEWSESTEADQSKPPTPPPHLVNPYDRLGWTLDLPPPPTPRLKQLDDDDDVQWDPLPGKMNNFSNFDANMNANAARQAPNAAQAQQLNGLNGASHWPNVGAQADMNVLWEYIQNLSQMHEGIRAQTQHVLNGVQQIQARAAGGDAPPHVNGAVNAPAVANPQAAEIARLQNELSTANNRTEDLTTYISKLQTLNQDYENALTHLMDKLRPYAQQHSQVLLSQKSHYLRLIEDERQQNLELRLEQSRWQESAQRISENLKLALREQTEAELPYIQKIAALKADNKSLRRLCGVPLMEDSDDDEEGEEEVEEVEQVSQGKRSQQQSPEQATAAEEQKKLLNSLGPS